MKPPRKQTALAALAMIVSALVCAHAENWVKDEAHLELIRKALPSEAPTRPLKPRRLLIFTLNVGYGGHGSIAYANEALTAMGRKTGAFDTEVSNDPEVFRPASLKRFDGVFFNNTVGNCFTNAGLRRSLLEFVTGGGGLLGVHGTAVAFTEWPGAKEDWPEFGYLLGGRGANHKDSDERVWVKVEDERHPLTCMFSTEGFEYRDEFFRVHEPYSRDRLRVLLSLDLTQTDLSAGGPPRGNCTRADNDYALAWIRNYGRGRVFYSTIAHNPYVFWDAQMLKFYLAALQFALGDLDVPTTPSARLTPARRAQEKLGWRLGVEAYTFHKFTFLEAIEKTAQLKLPYIGGLSFQQVSKELPKNFDPDLSDEELRQVRMKLETEGLRLLTYYIHDIPGDPAACQKVFEFGRKMGIETFLTEPKPEALDTIERFANEYGINVALHNHDQKASPVYWNPEGILKVCAGRSSRIGACGDIGYWLRSGIDPVAAARKLGSRLITVQVHDLNEGGADGHDVPWGTGVSQIEKFMRELQQLKVQPTMIGLEYSHDFLNSLPQVERSAQFFDQLSEMLAANTR